MTTRYFGVNSLAGCFRTITGIKEDTTAGRFDSAYVSNSIVIPNTSDYAAIKQPFLDGSTSLTTVFYLRFDLYSSNLSNVPSHLMLNAGANAYRLFLGGSGFQVQYWNSGTSAWVNWGSPFILSADTLHTCMLKLTPNVGYSVYLAGTLVASSAVVPTNGATAVDEFRLMGTASAASTYHSQIMCADFDIRDAHLMSATFSGNSASNTGGTGSYTDVNETVLDEGTAEIIAAAGKMGQTHAAITVPSGLGIGMAIINARGRVSGGTVTDGKLGFRVASTNYSSGAKLFNGGYEPRSHGVVLNPNTSTAWTQTTFNAAETFLEAV